MSVSAGEQVSVPEPPVSSYLQDRNSYLVVVCAEVFKVTETDVRQAHHDGDDQHHEGEHGSRGRKP